MANYPFWCIWQPNYPQNCQKIFPKNLSKNLSKSYVNNLSKNPSKNLSKNLTKFMNLPKFSQITLLQFTDCSKRVIYSNLRSTDITYQVHKPNLRILLSMSVLDISTKRHVFYFFWRDRFTYHAAAWLKSSKEINMFLLIKKWLIIYKFKNL